MAALRFHVLLGSALIASAGCAQQPVRADHTPPAAISPTASAQRLATAFPPRLLVFAYEQGWRQVVITGNERYFCRADAPSGSLIATPRCVTQSQLEFIQLTVQQQRQQLTRPLANNRSS